MKGWLFLVIAIVGEVIATSALKSSEGFTKLAPSAVVIIGYGIAFYFLSLVLKSGNDSNLLIVFYVQIMPDDFVMQLHRF